jgi:hypothetical protein
MTVAGMYAHECRMYKGAKLVCTRKCMVGYLQKADDFDMTHQILKFWGRSLIWPANLSSRSMLKPSQALLCAVCWPWGITVGSSRTRVTDTDVRGTEGWIAPHLCRCRARYQSNGLLRQFRVQRSAGPHDRIIHIPCTNTTAHYLSAA